MQLKLGPLATAVAGSIGGVTFQRAQVGTIARVKPLPIQRQGARPSSARAHASAVLQAWKSISPAEYADWVAWAASLTWYTKFGDPYTPTPYQVYLRCNMGYRNVSALPGSQTLITAPTAITPIVTPADLVLNYDTGGASWRVTSSDPSADADTPIAVFLSRPVTPYALGYYGHSVFIGSIPGGSGFPYSLTSQASQRITRPPQAGETYFTRFVPMQKANNYPGVPVEGRLTIT